VKKHFYKVIFPTKERQRWNGQEFMKVFYSLGKRTGCRLFHINDQLTLCLNCDVHCGKKYRKFPPQLTDTADHKTPVTENYGIKFSTSISECSATVCMSEFSAIDLKLNMC
jgi:hypothetical protein